MKLLSSFVKITQKSHLRVGLSMQLHLASKLTSNGTLVFRFEIIWIVPIVFVILLNGLLLH